MSILIRGVDMPACCADCFAYVDEGDFPYCRILHSDYWTYTFNEHESRMPSCPLADAEEQEKEIKALRLLVEWAEECDFGFDQFQDEYELYKDEIKNMGYIDGMIHVAKRTLEDNGAFEEKRNRG